ncbi:hypothetical protein RDWZM_009081, partial [Blomia tropicalis]
MGKPFWLNCSYELDNQGLYSIKWYHWNPDSNVNGEFYRWLPNDTPPGQMFPMKGIHLDLDRCNFGHVYFTKSDIFTDGSFRCEVSAEAPSFKTVRKEMELHVYSLPSGKPTIKGLGPDPSHYGPGDLINVECHSKPSRPAAKISWLINGEMINPKFVKTIPGPKQMDGLQSTRSEISFYSERSHYRNGLLKIHCIAKIDQQYDVHTDKILIGEPTKSANGHQTNVGKAQSSLAESMERDMPYISGFKNGPYRVGEYLNLTCVAKGKTAPRLTFFVNDVEANASQIRPFSVIRVSDGLFASKLMLEFAVEPNESPTSTTLLQSK